MGDLVMVENGNPAAQQAATILERSVCLTLSCHFLGNYRRVQTQEVVSVAGGTPDAQRDSELNATKRLVDSKELTAAMRVIGRAKDYLRSRAIPAHRVFGDRTYLLPIGLVGEVIAQLRDLQQQLEVEARLLAERYEAAKERQREKLGPMFRASDYPTPDQVRAAFGLEWHYVSFKAPEMLESIDSAVYEEEQAKVQDRFGRAYEEVELVLRETLRQIVADIARKLAPGDDGKPRTIRGTVLRDLADYVQTFQARDLTDDTELQEVVRGLRSLAGATPDDLRSDGSLREYALTVARDATDRLDTLVQLTRGRSFAFGGLAGEVQE